MPGGPTPGSVRAGAVDGRRSAAAEDHADRENPVKLRRAIVVLMSGQGQPAPDIAYLLKATEDYVRDVIHAFNERGFDALDPKWSGGTPHKISEQTRD
jgi:transposase